MSSTTPLSYPSTLTSTSTPDCTSVTPDKNGYVPYGACGSNYNYYPNFGAALFFAIAFGLSLTLHIFQAFFHKKAKLCWVIIMGVIWEFTSFTLRTLGTKDQQNDAYPFSSTVLVLLAPMWVNAFDYMVMGRMIFFFVPNQMIWGIRGIKIAKIFVWLDVLAFLVQLVGGTMIQPDADKDTVMRGVHIYMAGIGLQELFILIFTSISIKFYLVMAQHQRSLAHTSNQILDGRPHNWRTLLYVIYASLTLITIRVIFRMVEFAKGIEPEDNPIPFHEGYFLALDAMPVLIACILMNIVHPGRILKGEGSEFPKGPTRKEKKEAKRIKKMEKSARKNDMKALKGGKTPNRTASSSDNVALISVLGGRGR